MLNTFLGIFLALAAGAITNFFPCVIDKRNSWFPDLRKIRMPNIIGIIFSPLFIAMTYSHLAAGKICIGGKSSTCDPGGTGTLFTRGIPDEAMTYWLLIGIDVALFLAALACASLDFSKVKKEKS
jgi:hypothetical protein